MSFEQIQTYAQLIVLCLSIGIFLSGFLKPTNFISGLITFSMHGACGTFDLIFGWPTIHVGFQWATLILSIIFLILIGAISAIVSKTKIEDTTPLILITITSFIPVIGGCYDHIL